jgi:hypothetical protein
MKTLSCYFLIFCSIHLFSQEIGIGIALTSVKKPYKTGNDVLQAMHAKYKNGPCKAYTFSQKNTHYRNDSIVGHSEWHEYIEFPDKFRIDFGKSEEGNFVIFKNDSSYRYKSHTLKKVNHDPNTLLLLLGGMYFRELPDVINRLAKDGFKTEVLSVRKIKKETFYVIGAVANDTVSNQIWVTKSKLQIVRIIEHMDPQNTMDMSFDAFQKSCKGYTETKVTFKRNGKTEQVEEYYNILPRENMAKEIFNPK